MATKIRNSAVIRSRQQACRHPPESARWRMIREPTRLTLERVPNPPGAHQQRGDHTERNALTIHAVFTRR
jgi:hypothetical protein